VLWIPALHHSSLTPINRWFWCFPKHTISQSSPSFFKLSSLSYFFLLLSRLNTLSRYFLASSEILRRSENFLLYPGGLAQHTTNKSLRIVNLHVSGSILFCSWFVIFYNIFYFILYIYCIIMRVNWLNLFFIIVESKCLPNSRNIIIKIIVKD